MNLILKICVCTLLINMDLFLMKYFCTDEFIDHIIYFCNYKMCTLVFRGNPYLTHSYSIVMNNYIRTILKSFKDIKVVVEYQKPYQQEWEEDRSFSKYTNDQEIFKNLLIVDQYSSEPFETIITISFNFPAIESDYIFYTQEYSKGDQTFLKNIKDPSKHKWITPSGFSLNNQNDILPLKSEIIPHGIDLSIFKDYKKERKKYLLLCGAMTQNKGVAEALMFSFLVRRIDDDYRLILKTSSHLYDSQLFIMVALQLLVVNKMITYDDAKTIVDSTIILNGNYTEHEMADLYNECEAYVSMYRAEAFNLPVYEALACGCKVIIPSIGPTSELLNASDKVILTKSSIINNSIACDIMDAVNKFFGFAKLKQKSDNHVISIEESTKLFLSCVQGDQNKSKQ